MIGGTSSSPNSARARSHSWYTSPEVMSKLTNQKNGHAAPLFWHFRAAHLNLGPFPYRGRGLLGIVAGLLWLKLASGGSTGVVSARAELCACQLCSRRVSESINRAELTVLVEMCTPAAHTRPDAWAGWCGALPPLKEGQGGAGGSRGR